MSIFSYTFTLLSHLFGVSVGREGTGVQIGGTLGSKISDYLKLDPESRKILTKAGISVGFGAIFGTPLGGAFFGLEITSIGKSSYESMVPMTLVRCYPIGIIIMEDQGYNDEKIIAIPYDDPTYNGYSEISELPRHIFEEMVYFFLFTKPWKGRKQP